MDDIGNENVDMKSLVYDFLATIYGCGDNTEGRQILAQLKRLGLDELALMSPEELEAFKTITTKQPQDDSVSSYNNWVAQQGEASEVLNSRNDLHKWKQKLLAIKRKYARDHRIPYNALSTDLNALFYDEEKCFEDITFLAHNGR